MEEVIQTRWTAAEAMTHHGILGQKWGKKNGPPYPLNSSQYSAAEKKEKKVYDRVERPQQSTSSSKTEKNGLTNTKNDYIKIGATVVATALIAYGSYKMTSSPKFRSVVAKGMKSMTKEPSIEELLANSGPEIIRKMK